MTYIAMATAAIKALKDRTGSSSAAIKKYIVANYPTVTFAQHSLRQALKKGVADGLLTTVKSSYKLTDKVRKMFSYFFYEIKKLIGVSNNLGQSSCS